jgi:uncharacterized RDD family membrane protein YckC
MTNVYNAPGSNVTPDNQEYEYVGFWLRLLASIIDNIWLGIVIFVLAAVLVFAGVISVSESDFSPASLLLQFVLPFVLVVALWAKYASTPGKMIFKAKILDAKTFEPVSTPRLILRYIGYFVSVLTLFIGFIWVGIDSRKQGFHDKIAGTVVVKPK